MSKLFNIDKDYKEKILRYSMLINEAQKPIKILDSIKWDSSIEEFFIKTKFKEIPKVDHEYYNHYNFKFNPEQRYADFQIIIDSIKLDLGELDPIARILIRNCQQYQYVIKMLLNRGKKEYFEYSKLLYGSPTELLMDGKTRLSDLSSELKEILSGTDPLKLGAKYERNISSENVVKELRNRLKDFFGEENIKVKLSDGIVSDASAGADYIKIKSDSFFSDRDILIFEVHEGWVHLGTTLNGDQQKYAKWLSKGPPCSTVTQEGLAVIMELINFALFPKRAERLNDRLIVCQMVEAGANVLEVIEYYRMQNQTEIEAITNASRVFRGAPLEGGAPFTKDISYLKGFVENYNFLRKTIKNGKAHLIPFLFAGKVTLEDVPVLYHAYEEGIVDFPKFLPKQIKDLNGLMVWMAFSNFFNKMKLDSISNDVTEIKKSA